jgi:hypothetical protein
MRIGSAADNGLYRGGASDFNMFALWTFKCKKVAAGFLRLDPE